jgi:hypothetical protein
MRLVARPLTAGVTNTGLRMVVTVVVLLVGACGQSEEVPDVRQARRDCIAQGHRWREFKDETGTTRYACLRGGPAEGEPEIEAMEPE